nr:MAG: nucleotide pyrophosphohydrolase, MazG-like [uncultured archaeon]
MNVINLYERAIKLWGIKLQVGVLGEECCELATAVFHYLRGNRPNAITEIIEEIADVEIMIEQIKIGLDLETEVLIKKGQKLRRLKKIIDGAKR